MVEVWVTLTLVSAFFITFQRIVQKRVLNHEHASEYLTTFCMLTWVFLLPLIPAYGLDFNERAIGLILAKSILFSISSLYIVRANRHMEISTVEPLKNLAPIFILIFAIFFLNEIPTLMHLLGFLLLVGGSFLLEFRTIAPHKQTIVQLFKQKYIHYLFIAFIVGGASAIFDKFIVKEVSTLTTMFFLFLFTSICMMIYQAYKYKGVDDILHALHTQGIPITFITIVTLISDWFYFKAIALQNAPLSLVVPLRKASIILVVLFGGELFHEKHLVTKTIASLIMLIGVFLIAS